MGLGDSFSFRQKPTGAFKWILKVPGYLFRARLGFLFGGRFLLVTHEGRKSGTTYHTPVEVVAHDEASGECIKCSGTGPKADWYLNITAKLAATVQVRNRVWTPQQRILDVAEAAERFAAYERVHAKTAARLRRSMGKTYDGTDEGRLAMMAGLPMIAFGGPDEEEG